ncbi:MAG: hypothetical protein U0871_25130 [Gemmataceae bacterium]
MTPSYATAADLLGAWADDLRAGRPPVLYPVAEAGSPLAGIEVGPDLVTLLGGPPGAGKTALVMQLVVDALALTPTLKAAGGERGDTGPGAARPPARPAVGHPCRSSATAG